MKGFSFTRHSVVPAFAALFTLFASQAMALTAPAAGSFGYEAYNFLVNTILKGPFGAIAAILLFLVTIILLVKQQMVAGLICLTAAIVLINVSNMVTALGAVY